MVVQKPDTQFYFWGNLGNSAPILTILSLLQAEIYGSFMRHKFLLVTVKEWLKSVLNYRSYPKNKTGYTVFLDHPIFCKHTIHNFLKIQWGRLNPPNPTPLGMPVVRHSQ